MDSQDDPLRLDRQLCFAVYAASHAFTRLYKPRLEALGLTYPQYLVLLALWGEENQTVKSLGQKLFLDSGTLTPLLKRLEAAGHVTRRRDSTDERQVRIGLTEQGRILREKAKSVPLALYAIGADDRDPNRIETLREDLFRLREQIDAAIETL